MKIKIYIFDNIKSKELAYLSDYYAKLVSKYAQIDTIILKDKTENKITFEAIEKYVGNGFNFFLSENGKEYTTIDFAARIEIIKNNYSVLNFFISNAFGFDQAILDKANEVLSLSKMTLPHEMAYMVLLEQLFRCMNLSAGGKYHK